METDPQGSGLRILQSQRSCEQEHSVPAMSRQYPGTGCGETGKFVDKFRQWYLHYSTEITWFIIGMCTLTGLSALAREDYTSALINLGIAYLNYVMNKR